MEAFDSNLDMEDVEIIIPDTPNTPTHESSDEEQSFEEDDDEVASDHSSESAEEEEEEEEEEDQEDSEVEEEACTSGDAQSDEEQASEEDELERDNEEIEEVKDSKCEEEIEEIKEEEIKEEEIKEEEIKEEEIKEEETKEEEIKEQEFKQEEENTNEEEDTNEEEEDTKEEEENNEQEQDSEEVKDQEEDEEQEDEEMAGEEGEWASFEVPQTDEELEEFKVHVNTTISRKVSTGSEDMSLSSETSTSIASSLDNEEDSFEATSPDVQLQLATQQNNLHKKTIKQLQNALINVQEDCATYEQKYMQIRKEGEKMYEVLFTKVATLKNLTKQNETLQASNAMKDQMIYNQKLHIEEFKNAAASKGLEVIEWQTRCDRANESYEDALQQIEKRDEDNAKLTARVEDLEKTLEIQRGLRESAHTDSQAQVAIIEQRDAEILKLTEVNAAATRELNSLISFLEAKSVVTAEKIVEPATETPAVESQNERLAELVAQLADVQAQLDSSTASVEALTAELRSAEKVSSEISTKCQEKERETEQLKAEVQKVVAKVVEATGRADEMAQNFRSQLADAQNELSAKDAEIAELRSRPQESELVGDNMQQLELQAKVTEYESQLAEAAKQLEHLDFSKLEVEGDLAQEREASEALRAQVASLQMGVEEKQKEVAGLVLKLQLANELKEMRVAATTAPPSPPPKQSVDAEIQTEPVSTSYRRVSMQQSPTLLVEQLEAMQISNELLRGDNLSFQKRMDKMQQSHSTMQSKLREAEARVEEIAARLKATVEGENEKRELLLQQHMDEIARLEMTIQELLDKQHSAMEDQETIEEAKVAIERERTLHAKLTEQTSINQNLQNDLRLLYLKHKKDLAELQEQYQHEQYKERYLEVVNDRNIAEKKLETLSKIMKDITTKQAKGGFIEAMKENVNTMNIQSKSSAIKVEQMRSYQAASMQAFTSVKKLEKKLNAQKLEIHKMVEDKDAHEMTWNVRRSEWESLCEKIAIERDVLRADNEKSASISSKFEGMFKSAQEENQGLIAENSKLKEEIAKMKDTNEFLDLQVGSTEESITNLESQLQETSAQLEAKAEELTVMTTELESAEQSLSAAREQIEQLSGEIKALCVKSILVDVAFNAEKTAWKKTETILNERVNQLNITITNYERLVQKNQCEAVEKENGEIVKLNTEVARLNAEVAKLSAEVSHWSKAHNELSDFVEDERAIKDEQLQESEDRAKDLDSRLQEQTKAATELAADKQTLEFECKLLHEQVEELQKEIECGKSNIQAIQEEVQRVSLEKAAVQEQVEASAKNAAEAEADMEKKYAELVQAKKQVEESFSAQFVELQERAQNVEREFNAKISAEAVEKSAAQTRVAEIEAELLDSEQRLSRKSELVQSLQDELAVFAECLKQKEKEVEGLADKLQSLLQVNTQKETELSVRENEMSMKFSQLQSELEIARSQSTQLQTENARLKKAVSEVTSQTMAVNSRHLDAASKLRETISQLTDKSDKAAKDLEAAEKVAQDLKKRVSELEKENAALVDKASSSEQAQQGNSALEKQCKKLAEDLKAKSDKLEEATAKLSACVATNNTLNAKLKEFISEKTAHDQEISIATETNTKLKARISTLEAGASRDQQAIAQLKQTSATVMANESKLDGELRKAVGYIAALKGEKEKIAAQLEACLKSSMDQEQSAILRMKFNLEREVAALVAINDSAKSESSRFKEEMEHYKASVAKFKERAEAKMKVQAANLQKAEEEVEALDTCLKQLRALLARHENFFQASPELIKLYNRFVSMMGQDQQYHHSTPSVSTPKTPNK